MPPLVDFARSLALTFFRLTPEERSRKIQAYLLVGAPGRGAVALTDEAALVLRNYERLRAGAPAYRLIPRSDLPRSRDKARCMTKPETAASREKRRRAALARWQRRRDTKAAA
jgi:hypothetical protein